MDDPRILLVLKKRLDYLPDITPQEYQKVEELGRGSFGVVYKVRRISSDEEKRDKYWAMKEIDLEKIFWMADPQSQDPDYLAAVRREVNDLIRELGILHYLSQKESCVPEIQGKDVRGNSLFIFMEMIEGPDLFEVLKDRSDWGSEEAFTMAERIEMLYDLTGCLHTLHEAGVAHRDLKPENIIWNREEDLVIVDLGLACSMDQPKMGCPPNPQMVGTRDYMAPELQMRPWLIKKNIQIPQPYDYRQADLFSLGMIFFIIMTGSKFLYSALPEKVYAFPADHFIWIEPDEVAEYLSQEEEEISDQIAELTRELIGSDPVKRPSTFEVLKRLTAFRS